MARITRIESQTRNRELVLDSARLLFLRDGYQATGIAAVAEEAGFSTGVVYSNFAGKAELGLHALRAIQDEQFAELSKALAAHEPFEAKLKKVQVWAEAALDSGWPRFELEFALDARTDASLVAVEAQRAASATESFAQVLGRLVPDTYASLIPIDTVAEIVINVAFGIAVRRVIDPSVRVDAMLDSIRQAARTLGITEP